MVATAHALLLIHIEVLKILFEFNLSPPPSLPLPIQANIQWTFLSATTHRSWGLAQRQTTSPLPPAKASTARSKITQLAALFPRFGVVSV